MTDFDTIWRTQDEIRTVVRSSSARLLPTGRKNAVVGECIWYLSYNQHRMKKAYRPCVPSLEIWLG